MWPHAEVWRLLLDVTFVPPYINFLFIYHLTSILLSESRTSVLSQQRILLDWDDMLVIRTDAFYFLTSFSKSTPACTVGGEGGTFLPPRFVPTFPLKVKRQGKSILLTDHFYRMMKYLSPGGRGLLSGCLRPHRQGTTAHWMTHRQ